MLRERSVTVVLHHRIREHGGVTVEKRHVVELITEDGESWRAKVFCRLQLRGRPDGAGRRALQPGGRESGQEYGEKSRRSPGAPRPRTSSRGRSSAYTTSNMLSTRIDLGPLAPRRLRRQKVQAYNFRPGSDDDSGAS